MAFPCAYIHFTIRTFNLVEVHDSFLSVIELNMLIFESVLSEDSMLEPVHLF